MNKLERNVAESFPFTYEGEEYVAEWATYSREGQVLDAFVEVTYPNGDEVRESTLSDKVKFAACDEKRARMQNEKGIDFTKVSELTPDDVLELVQKAWLFGWIGQFNSLLYTQDVSNLLTGEPYNNHIFDLVKELHRTKAVGFTGNIFIEYAEEEATFARMKESSGHERLTVTDFGYWGCSACGKHGDDYDNPSDFLCDVEAYQKTLKDSIRRVAAKIGKPLPEDFEEMTF